MTHRRPSERDEVTEHLYATESWSLVGLSKLLVDQQRDAEDVVQEAFARLYSSFRRIDDRDRALAYLRSIVLNQSRNRLKRRRTARERQHLLVTEARAANTADALSGVDRSRVVGAIRDLPRRQAECTEREIADTLGISAGSVKQHLSRARQRLSTELEELR